MTLIWILGLEMMMMRGMGHAPHVVCNVSQGWRVNPVEAIECGVVVESVQVNGHYGMVLSFKGSMHLCCGEMSAD